MARVVCWFIGDLAVTGIRRFASSSCAERLVIPVLLGRHVTHGVETLFPPFKNAAALSHERQARHQVLLGVCNRRVDATQLLQVSNQLIDFTCRVN